MRLATAALCAALVGVLGLLLRASDVVVPSGAWYPSYALQEDRVGASAALLSDGRVLVTGGIGQGGTLATAEIYSGSAFSPASPLFLARSRHTSTTLKDGRVLVTGGVANSAATNEAEIYDPITDSWSIIQPMAETRAGHVATLLEDGRVLISGGEASGTARSKLEIFDPAAAEFRLIPGSLSSPRKDHAAALLRDGGVLIVGGSDGSAVLASTEVFDPISETISAGPTLTTPRTRLSATALVDGRVLIAGGNNGVTDLNSAEIYDAGNISEASGKLSVPRSGHLAFLLPHNNAVLMVSNRSADLFLPWTSEFVSTGSPAFNRNAPVGTPLLGDGVLVVAGGGTARTELYRFATIQTDKNDYAPGDAVTMTGSGWEPGELVTLYVHEVPRTHLPQILFATADASGNISNAEWSPEPHDSGVTFYLTAVGEKSQAQTRFTDADPASSMTWTRVEENNAAVQYTGAWYATSRSVLSGGRAVLALDSASATFSFSGTAARWIGLKDSWSGIGRVYVDGVFKTEVDSYSVSTQYQTVMYQITGLASGDHTLKVEATGRRNPASRQAWIWVDAFEWASGDTSGNSPDFTLTAGPNSATVTQGGSTAYSVSVAPQNGFTGTISLSATGFGSGATGSFSPATITGSGSSTLTVNTTATAQTGTFTLTITGTSGTLTHAATVTLTLNPAGGSTTNGSPTGGSPTWTRVEENNAAVQYTGAWYTNSRSVFSGGRAVLALDNAAATFSFSGVAARWIGLRDSWSGIGRVYVDGVFKTEVDLYSASTQYQFVLYQVTGLTSGDHTLKIEATGRKNTAARQAWIWVDAFEFIPGTTTATVISAPAVAYNTSAPVTVTVTSAAMTPTGNVSLAVDGGTPMIATLSNGAAAFTIPSPRVGDHTLSASYAAQGNFSASSAAATLRVTPRAITVTADPKSKTYGDPEPDLTYHVTSGSLVNGDSFSGSLSRDAGESVGTYAIRQGTFALGANYSLTFAGANMTISPKTASVTPNSSGKAYGSPDPALSGTLSGFLSSDNVTAIFSRTPGEDVGTYTIGATLGPSGVLNNYQITSGTASFVIAPLTASVSPEPATKTFGDADPSLVTTGTLSGFLSRDGVTATYSREPGEAPGTYSINAMLSPPAVLRNYAITYNTAKFTINKYIFNLCDGNECGGGSHPNSKGIGATLTITASVPYEGNPTAAVNLSPATVGGKDALTSPGLDANNQPLPPVFQLWIASVDDPTHPVFFGRGTAAKTGPDTSGNDAWHANITAPLGPSIVPGSYKVYVYGDDGAALTSNAVQNDSGYLSADTNDFIFRTLTASLTVVQAIPNITVTAENATYTASPYAGPVTCSATGPRGEELPASLTYEGRDKTNYASSATPPTNAGTYNAVCSVGGIQSNFALTSKRAQFDIFSKPASVTPAPAAKTYGSSDPELTGTLNGFIASDNVTAVYRRTAGETVAGGPYTISATLGPGSVLDNYAITYNTANFTIVPKPASVTPNAASKIYGSSDPALSGTASGFLEADSVTSTYNRAAGETVAGSPYTISAVLSPASVLTNYAIAYNTANFTIIPKDASVTPASAAKIYGSSDPALTGTLTGFLAPDNVTATYSRTSGETVLGSPYAIGVTLSPANVLTNYAITYNTASFTITPKSASVAPAANGKNYGNPDPPLTGVLSGFLTADNVSAIYARAPGESMTGNPYVISATLGPANVLTNYAITYGTAIFTIIPKTDRVIYTPSDYTTYQSPAVGESYTDSVFGPNIKRVSDSMHTIDDGRGSGMVTTIVTEFSTMSPFNQDNTRLLLVHLSYFGLYDGAGKFIRNLPFEINASAEPRWSRTDPNILYYKNGNRLKQYNVETKTMSVIHTFSEYSAISGRGESDICFDGNHFVFVGDGRYVFVYEISTDTKGNVFDTGGIAFDSLYITPNDNVTITWSTLPGTGRYHGIELFDRDMNFLRQVARAGGHMDVTRDANGDEVLVWMNAADTAPICNNGVVKIRLADASQTCLLTLDWSLAAHISATDNSGWVFVETYAPGDPIPPSGWFTYTGELIQVKLDGTAVRRLAHHRSRPFNSYSYQPRLSISRDGRKLAYSSNFGLQSTLGYPMEYSDAYLIDVAVESPGTTGTAFGASVSTTSLSGDDSLKR